MITDEQQGNLEAKMNSEQVKGSTAHDAYKSPGFSEVLKEQGLGHEPKAQDDQPSRSQPPPLPQPLDDERSAVSTSEAHEEEEGEFSPEKLGSILEKPEIFYEDSIEDRKVVVVPTEKSGSKLEKPEAVDEQHSTEEGEVVVVSPMKEETVAPTPQYPRMSVQVDAESSLAVDDNSIVSPQGLLNAAPVQDEGFLMVSSPSGKKRSKGRHWKKNGGKKKLEKEVGELSGGGALRSRDAGTQTDQQELQRNANESDPAGLQASGDVDDGNRAAEGQEQPGLKSSNSEEQVRDEDVLHERESTSAVVGRDGDDVVEEERDDKVDPSLASFKALRSFGRWADVSEDVDTRATDTEPDGLTSQTISVNRSSDNQEQELRVKPEQRFEGPQGQDIRTGVKTNNPDENELRGKSQLAVEVSPRQDIRGSPRSPFTEELRGKSHQGYESPRSRHDPRADSWSNHKEDLRGKTQQSRDRDSLSQASRESNWRRRPVEPRVRQDMPRSTGKLGLDGDTKKDEHLDFRSRSQYGSEPQATHKNWIPRKGLHSRGDGEGRAEQSRARGKAKQGREVEPQNQLSKDSARQKFEADLRIKQEELLQRSKQSLKAEFQKAKRIEQAKKGGEQLEMELNKNLVYEDGELFYLNI